MVNTDTQQPSAAYDIEDAIARVRGVAYSYRGRFETMSQRYDELVTSTTVDFTFDELTAIRWAISIAYNANPGALDRGSLTSADNKINDRLNGV